MSEQRAAQQHGFTYLRSEELPELEGTAHIMRHDASGARLLFIRNDDDNKAFSISFKTPPKDDTGVFHILEHSVLCGSRKFPVKEPFVNLLKNSMQTFLNAMTFSDKTMYPVASTNSLDLMNLMDVYMDAVLNPAIYSKETIFSQEGWHVENKDGRLSFNGVVYNEMKGALSDPADVLNQGLSAKLFPSTAYGFVSGGLPRAIPSLSYQDFLAAHRRHYRLDNSYLILYGNLDLDTFLAFLDDNYLTPYARLNTDSPGPWPLRLQEPLISFGNTVKMCTAPENETMAIGYVAGTFRDRRRMTALSVLLDAVAGSNEAPLKRALIDADLGADASVFLMDGTLQPYACLEIRGMRKDAAARVRRVFEEAVARIAKQGIGDDLLEAAISHEEFFLRERNFGIADGVAFSMTALSSWLYDDDNPCSYLRFADDFAFLREQIGTGYFEHLLEDIFIHNNHVADMHVVPVAEEEPDCALQALQEKATPDYLERIDRSVEELRRAQEAPDTPEQLATLPALHVADIDPAKPEPAYELLPDASPACVRHWAPTHGIAYASQFFSLENIAFDDLPYVALLSQLLCQLETAQHTPAQLDVAISANLGNLSFSTVILDKDDTTKEPSAMLLCSASALEPKADTMAELAHEVMTTTRFTDLKRIRQILEQSKIGLEQAFGSRGHSFAMARVASYYLPSGLLQDALGGIRLYEVVRATVENFDTAGPVLAEKLQRLAECIFCDSTCINSFGGSQESFDAWTGARPALPGAGAGQEASLVVPEPLVLNEAFALPTDVVFCAAGYDRRLMDRQGGTLGTWALAKSVLGLDFLWNEVRVKGGAYGAGFQPARTGNLRFYSYRDPHVDETMDRFRQAGSWLAAFNPTNQELEGYKVSVVASIDAPVKPRGLISRQMVQHLADRSPLDRMNTRQQVLEATVEDLRAIAPLVERAAADSPRCVFGNRTLIEESGLSWNVVDLLGQSAPATA